MTSKLQVIIASTRPGRAGMPIGDWFARHARADGRFEIEVTDLAELGLPLLDEPHHPRLREYVHDHTWEWSRVVDSSDAFVFVMPEYNHGFAAPIKNAVDYLYEEWAYKPVGFVSYGGLSAGMRAVQMMKPVLTALRMFTVTDQVALANFGSYLSDGVFHPDQPVEHAAGLMLAELERAATALSVMRPQLST